MKDHITIAGHDGAFAAYIARPKTVPAPARRQRSPTGGQANFYINNCGDLRSLQPFRATGTPSPSDRTAFLPLQTPGRRFEMIKKKSRSSDSA